MEYSALSLQKLVEQFRRMPGIGAKPAQRMAFYILGLPQDEAKEFADTVLQASEKIHRCPKCCNLTDKELCPVCSDPKRNTGIICVVENVESLMAIDREYKKPGGRAYRNVYFKAFEASRNKGDAPCLRSSRRQRSAICRFGNTVACDRGKASAVKYPVSVHSLRKECI